MSDENKKDELNQEQESPAEQEPANEPPAEIEQQVVMTAEGVRQICREVFGEYLDKFTPPEIKTESENESEPENDDFEY